MMEEGSSPVKRGKWHVGKNPRDHLGSPYASKFPATQLVTVEDDDLSNKKRKFLFRLALALHKAGNFAFDSERSLEILATKLGLCASFNMFPVTLQAAFYDPDDPELSGSYMFGKAFVSPTQ